MTWTKSKYILVNQKKKLALMDLMQMTKKDNFVVLKETEFDHPRNKAEMPENMDIEQPCVDSHLLRSLYNQIKKTSYSGTNINMSELK